MTMENQKNNVLKSDENFWNSRYETGQTGWDIGEVSVPVREYADQLKDKTARILIPGCGNAYEAAYLSSKGFSSITLLDISGVLINKLEKIFKSDGNISLVNQDFFEHEGSYDIIIEQTFFCALDPVMREAYAEKARSLLSENGRLAGVLFDKEFEKQGPPFGGSEEEYRILFSKHFHINILEKCRNSITQRSGSEVFINLKPKNT